MHGQDYDCLVCDLGLLSSVPILDTTISPSFCKKALLMAFVTLLCYYLIWSHIIFKASDNPGALWHLCGLLLRVYFTVFLFLLGFSQGFPDVPL